MEPKVNKRGNGFFCIFCDKHFSCTTSQPIHIRRHIKEKPYNCQHCDFAASCISDVYLHERKIHYTGHFKCTVCQVVLKSAHALKSHFFKLHHAVPKPHECALCGERFQLKSNLTQHARIHSAAKSFNCDLCGAQFPLERSFNQHANMGCDQHNKIYRGKAAKSKSTVVIEATKPVVLPGLKRKATKKKKEVAMKKEESLKIVKVFSVEDY